MEGDVVDDDGDEVDEGLGSVWLGLAENGMSLCGTY